MKDMFKQASIAFLVAGALLSQPTLANSEPNTGAADTVQTISKVNLNTATVEQLTNLPGIGPKKAQAIIEYRNQYGEFLIVEDIQNVKGIGQKAFVRLESLIKV